LTEISATETALHALRVRGFDFFSGVADSLLAPLISGLEDSPEGYHPACREDLALGLAAGAYLAGRKPVVLMQNSGLGYCLNVLTSLNLIYRIPVLMIVGFRGFEGLDAPEHRVMGAHCRALLEQVGIPTFCPEPDQMEEVIERAQAVMEPEKIPAAIFIKPNLFS